MPEWAAPIIIALVGASASIVTAVGGLQKVKADVKIANAAADKARAEEWDLLTKSQRSAMAEQREEYQTRLSEITSRLREVEAQLLHANEKIAELNDTVREICAEREEWVSERALLVAERDQLAAERDALCQKITELEAGK